MFFQSLLPSFNLQNATANNAAAAEQQQPNVEQAAAARVVAQVPAGDNDEVAEVDRHLQAINMNLDNATGEGMFL